MDCNKVGALIARLRKEKGLTQRQLGDAMNISDKTVSKWERGLGCPDVSLLRELSAALGVDLEKLLEGALSPNRADSGNLNRVRFYVCPTCGGVVFASGGASVSCCGRKLQPLHAEAAEGEHRPSVAYLDDELYITFPHEMRKEHYLSFAAWVTGERVYLVRLYPEQEAALHLPRMHLGKLYFYCTNHGLFVSK
ncbi:MAG: helix-turn-helix domain-containing protein [Clostridiaceae bacterium]|nr:helix-turn-helix domain-containing protein [Clostridiaceae bacterium]